jgi:hypothetical protein
VTLNEAMRQNTGEALDLAAGGRGEASRAAGQGVEASGARREAESLAECEQLRLYAALPA